jgi:hypothetical protein
MNLLDCGFRLVLITAIPSLVGLLAYSLSGHFTKPFCATNTSTFTCAACPPHATCPGNSHFFECELGFFQLYRICAEPGAHIMTYTPDLHDTLYGLQREIYQIASVRRVNATAVVDEFARRSESILGRLNATDISNIWTYEGDNYWIDAEGILVASAKGALPGFWTVSALTTAIVFLIVLVLS